MRASLRFTLRLALCAAALAPALGAAYAQTLQSPDGNVRVTLTAAPLTYAVTFNGHSAVDRSTLGLTFAGAAPLTSFRIESQSSRTTDRAWTPVWGTASHLRDHYRQLALNLVELDAPHRHLTVEFRAYNDGVAFRYIIPEQPGLATFALTRELTSFSFPGDTTVYASSYRTFHSPYESEYPRRTLQAFTPQELVGLPALTQPRPDTLVAITEADLTDWAGLYLQHTTPAAFTATLSPPRNDLTAAPVRGTAPRRSPWRVLMLASSPAELVGSNLIDNLSTPSLLSNASWIKPGLMAWDPWWSSDVDMTNAAMQRYIDFASAMGFPYQLVDWQWYGPFNKPTADITRPAPQLDMPALLRYAADRHVRLWLWLHSADVDRALAAGTLDAAFALYERWGVAGVKIDFMESDDQDRVRWYADIVQRAAEHHLMVDFHGAYKPTGLRNTLPNLLTREAVLGNEYNKFSSRVTPAHKATLPFTRGLVGPMDFTPGGFLNRSPAEFQATKPTQVMGSRASELALFVLYFSPLTTVCDDPAHYIAADGTPAPGLSFLRELPTTWDETRGLDGAVGEHAITARRHGSSWFLGGITAGSTYDTLLPLSFLGPGHFAAHIYADPADSTAPYTAIAETTRTVSATDTLPIHMRAAGGIAIRFDPLP